MQDVPAEASMADREEYAGLGAIDLGAVLRALADPLRRRVISELARAPDGTERTCASFELPVSKSTLTHHFKVLRDAGLINQVDRGNSRAACLCRADIERKWPGLLALVAADRPEGK